MINQTDKFLVFESFLPKEEWRFLEKTMINYTENKLLKLLLFFNIKKYRKYYLKVFYKDKTTALIPIDFDSKNSIKKSILNFNLFLTTLN